MPRYLLLALLATSLCLGAALATKPDRLKADEPKPDEFKMSDVERALVDRTNAERKKKDLPELKPNPKLFVAARKHTAHMARVDRLAHELDGRKLSDRVKEAGYQAEEVGENVASGQPSAEEVVTEWMKAEDTRKHILDSKYTEIGVGVAKNAKGMLYFTQMFGNPAR